MAVVLPGVVASEEGVESGNLDQVHASSENVACRIRRDADAVVRVCRVEGDGLNHWKRIVYILLVIELTDIAVRSRGGRGGSVRIPNSHCVLHGPFVDGFRGMGHITSSSEVGLGQYIRQRSSMVHVEAICARQGQYAVRIYSAAMY